MLLIRFFALAVHRVRKRRRWGVGKEGFAVVQQDINGKLFVSLVLSRLSCLLAQLSGTCLLSAEVSFAHTLTHTHTHTHTQLHYHGSHGRYVRAVPCLGCLRECPGGEALHACVGEKNFFSMQGRVAFDCGVRFI